IKANGCAVGVVIAAALLGGGAIREWAGVRVGSGVVLAAVLLALLALTRRPGATVFERGYVAVALLPGAVAVALAAWVDAAPPLVHRDAHGSWDLEILSTCKVTLPVLTVPLVFLGGMLARRIGAAWAGPARGLAWTAVIVSAVLVVTAARRRFTAEGY